MSSLRPTLTDCHDGSYAPNRFDSFYMIRDAVERRNGLIHGKLRDATGVCAIGAFFDDNPKLALNPGIIEEVAAYNDSLKRLTPWQRRVRVLRWLTAKIALLGWKPKAKRKRAPTPARPKLKVVA